MNTIRRSHKLLALATASTLVIAACGSDSDDGGAEDTTAGTEATEGTEAPEGTTAETTEGTEAPEGTTEGTDGEEPSGEAAMIMTVDLAEDAVWEDGSPITYADIQCTWEANLNTPGSLSTVGYDKISSVEAGESDKQAVITFSGVFAPYKTIFDKILQKSLHEDCNDVSLDYEDGVLLESASPYKMDTWSTSGSVLVPNENWWGDAPVTDRIVMTPLADSDTEIAALKAGEVDFIYPQFYAGIQDALAQDNVNVQVDFGGDYEGFYFQSSTDESQAGPFADPIFREAFSLSIDREAVFQQIYVPIEASAELLQCGPIVPGVYCESNADGAWADNAMDLAAAETLLTDAGWTKGGDGYWADADGNVPEIRWIVNTGNTRREDTQAFLIPQLQAAGFNVIADNCDAACYFQQRLPALDYDMAMYISTAPPDPSYLTSSFTCNQIPTESNGFIGQNSTGWCNEEASAMLEEADTTVDEAARADLVKQALVLMEEDNVMLPLFQFPKSGAWLTDKVGSVETVGAELNNYMAFDNLNDWEDLDGDGQIILGAEQWPECLNPVTECANSSWYVWTVAFPVLPALWRTTNDATFELTSVVASEPVVEVL